MAPPTAPAAAPAPAPTAVLVATRPPFPVPPPSAPADSASFRQASISCAAVSFPTDCICALGYKIGCAVEQAASISNPQMSDRSLCLMASPIPFDFQGSSEPVQAPQRPL